MPRLCDLGEFEVIRRLARARATRAEGDGVIVDSGDDAAVLRPREGRDLVATTDAFVEGVHWRPGALGPRDLGARLAAANLSDLAAMAAAPRWALLSLGVRADHDVDALMELQSGLAAALAAEGAVVVGGNLAAVAGAEWLDLTVLGDVERGRAWTRFAARPGDLVAVTGRPGRAGAGCAIALRLGEEAKRDAWRPLVDAWLRPSPRVRLALALAPLGAVTAAIDLSDGLAGDLSRLCEASGVGAGLDEAAWPADERLRAAARELGVAEEKLWFGPSDDYELLLALDPALADGAASTAAREGVPLHVIGRFTAAPGLIERVGRDGERRPLPPTGWDHFGASAGS